MRWTKPAAAVALLLAVSACSLLEPRGEQLFRAGDLEAAEKAYVAYLDSGHASGRKHERALYHLGLIHARQGGGLYEPTKARRYLERLLALEPPSRYSLHAALVLNLQLETNRLRDSIADQDDLVERLRLELERMRSETERIETAATDEQARAKRLAALIAALREQITTLSEELAAREEELERIKRIDLEDPP